MANDATVKFGYDGTALNRGLAQQETKLKGFASTTERSFRGAQAAIGGLGLGILAREGVRVVAAFDRMTRGMTTLEGSATGAKFRMDELREASKLPGLDFEQAVQGDIRLRSVGVSAELSKKALIEMGNALSLAGGTSADLDGVVLALTQIISKGKVSAEEINQIAERVPQVRAVMKDMFGTADTETLQKMNIDAETFVATLVEGFGKLERAQAGLDEKMNDFSTSLRTASTALLEGLVGKGSEGLSRLGGVLDANNDKLREAGQWLGNTASGVAEWFVNAGDAIGFMAADLQRAIGYMGDADGLAKYQAETQGILEMMQAQKDSVEIERMRTEQITASTEARAAEIKLMDLPKSVLEDDPIRKAGEEANKPVSKEQARLDDRKRKLTEAELPLKEQIAAAEDRLLEQQQKIEESAANINQTEKESIENQHKLLDIQQEISALKRLDEQAEAEKKTPVATPSLPSSPTATQTSFTPRNEAPMSETKTYKGYDEQNRRLTDGRRKILGVQTPDTYTGGPLVTGDRRLSGPNRSSLTPGGGLDGFYARQNVGSGSGSMSINTSGARTQQTVNAARKDDLSSKIDRTNELLSRGLLGS
jgi:tape measure domain-containing protein